MQHKELRQRIECRDAKVGAEQCWGEPGTPPSKRSQTIRDVDFPADADSMPQYVVFHEQEFDRRGNLSAEVIDSGGLALRTELEYDDEDNLWKAHSPNAKRSQSPDAENYVEYAYDP